MKTTSVPMWLPSDPRRRRGLAATLLILMAALIVSAVVVPAVLLHRHYDVSIARLSRQVSTQTAFNAMRPRLTEKLEKLKSRDVRKFFLKGTSSALALAELQETVRGTIESNGGRVAGSSPQGNATKDEGTYRPVAATFTFNANNTNLRRVLYMLETREPYLFVESIVIQPQVGSTWRPPPGSPEPDMFVQLDVRGFALRAASELAPAGDPVVPAQTNSGKGRNPDATAKDKGGTT